MLLGIYVFEGASELDRGFVEVATQSHQPTLGVALFRTLTGIEKEEGV